MTLGMERREREKNKNGLIFSPLPLLARRLTPPGGRGWKSQHSVSQSCNYAVFLLSAANRHLTIRRGNAERERRAERSLMTAEQTVLNKPAAYAEENRPSHKHGNGANRGSIFQIRSLVKTQET